MPDDKIDEPGETPVPSRRLQFSLGSLFLLMVLLTGEFAILATGRGSIRIDPWLEAFYLYVFAVSFLFGILLNRGAKPRGSFGFAMLWGAISGLIAFLGIVADGNSRGPGGSFTSLIIMLFNMVAISAGGDMLGGVIKAFVGLVYRISRWYYGGRKRK